MEKKTLNSKESQEKKEKDGIFWNTFWVICILVSIVLITISSFFINDFNNNIKKYNLNYRWPQLFDLFPVVYLLPMVICFKLFIENISKNLIERCLSKKYKQPHLKELANKYRRKLARHLYKITFYTGITVFGYYVLKDLPYFPKSMGGKGYMSAMFLPGFPNSYFHQKPPLFDFYYNLNLAYFVCDFIFLLLDERQNDFINMFLHHICTISLIVFSFITNYSNIGCLVVFCHMESDILGHAIRFVVQTDLHIYFIGFVGISFLSNFIYMRQYVFGEMIYTIYKYITWKWDIITTSLWLFLVILYIMHFRWSSILLVKEAQIVFQKKRVTDDVKYVENKDKNKNHED